MYEYDFCEYAVEKKKKGAYLGKIIAVAVLCAIYVAAVFAVVVPLAGMSIALLALALGAALVWYLSRFSAIEYEYTQTGTTLDVASVYSKQYRKEKLSIDIKKSARSIAPYTGKLEGNIAKVYDFRSEENAPNAYAIIFEEDKKRYALLFDANEKIIENLRHHVPSKLHK